MSNLALLRQSALLCDCMGSLQEEWIRLSANAINEGFIGYKSTGPLPQPAFNCKHSTNRPARDSSGLEPLILNSALILHSCGLLPYWHSSYEIFVLFWIFIFVQKLN